MKGWARRCALAALFAASAAVAPRDAAAFNGFHVGGPEKKLQSSATMVVVMREGARTVVSMQAHYKGPAEGFAMVVPVPAVLDPADIKTLPRDVFERVDRLSAPRLVEYWEQDPCSPARRKPEAGPASSASPPPPPVDKGGSVDVQASFAAGEYEIVVLSATDSQTLDAWLRTNQYAIPEGAEEVLRPYVQNGMKFFVAKVDPAKVTFKDGAALLSPLRFQFDSDKLTLPVRLGLLNAEGKQDLIVHILARGKRYEASNYKNVTIPTNLDVAAEAKTDFSAFYAALFDRTLEENPGSVITEYAWDASSCDPCPVPALSAKDLLTLGADALTQTEEQGSLTVTIQNVAGGVIADASEVVGTMKADLDKCVAQGKEDLSATLLVSAEVGAEGEVIATKSSQVGEVPAGVLSCVLRRVAAAKFAAPDPAAVLDARVRISLQLGAMPLAMRLRGGFVLTRLHARYDKASLGEDIAFAEAEPIMGGREVRVSGKLESGSTSGSTNAFQGRYVVRHPWSGKLECPDPVRGEWGGPAEGSTPAPVSAVDLAFAPRGKVKLASLLAQDVPEIGVTGEAKPKEEPKKEATPKAASSAAAPPPEPAEDEGCSCRVAGGPASRVGHAWPLLAALALAWRRRRRV